MGRIGGLAGRFVRGVDDAGELGGGADEVQEDIPQVEGARSGVPT